ncbi:MAG: hypothetical protein VYC71_08990, partial [Planctomycetota bacterium]|nr:hypothetical protein [Planctomycetota bacterium]
GVTDVGLAHLKDLPALVYLNLYGTQVSDAGLEHLKGLSSLKNFMFGKPKSRRRERRNSKRLCRNSKSSLAES